MENTIALIGWEWLLALFVVAVIAGVIDTLAGGGGLITVPILLLCQLTPIQALATNKAQAVFGTLTSTITLLRRGLIHWLTIRSAFYASLVGSILGTLCLHFINADALMILVPIVLITVAIYFALTQHGNDVDRQARISDKQYLFGVVPAIGFYDGFFGPGTGSFFSFTNVALMGKKLIHATANAKCLNLASNLASLFIFVFSGQVIWLIAFIMLLGQIIGAYLGSHLVIHHGQRLIRPVIVVVCLVMCGKILLEQFF